MNTAETVEALKDVPLNSILFVSYIPGRKPGARALAEGKRAIQTEGLCPRHFTGRLTSVGRTKKHNEVYFTLWVEERDSTDNGRVVHGAYRAFNPALGTLLSLEVVQKA